jgi:hypothetical protein
MAGDALVVESLEPGSLERVAAEWLAAEETVASGGGGNPAAAEILARDLSDQYDAAIRAAGREELRLAEVAARRLQGDQEMGSAAWASARRLAELLGDEYLAADPDRPSIE